MKNEFTNNYKIYIELQVLQLNSVNLCLHQQTDASSGPELMDFACSFRA